MASHVDEQLVSAQLGRRPRDPWRVAVRCPFGYPRVLASPSRLLDGTPFPTTFWLSCPRMIEAVSDIESAGGVAEWDERLADQPLLKALAREAETAYRAARTVESGGVDACGETGIAGIGPTGGVKCLHARVAAALAGVPDPVGLGVLKTLPTACEDELCAELGEEER